MIQRWPVLLLALLVASLSAPARAEKEPPNLAILPLWSVGVSKPALRSLERDLGREVKGLPGIRLQARKATENHLKAARSMGLGCDKTDVECFVRVGVLAGTERVVAGFVRPGEGGLHLELRLVDVNGGSEIRRADKLLDKKAQRPDLRDVVTRLLAPSRHTGRLALEVEPRGARVVVDGLARGAAPLKGPLALSADFHRVRVELDGYTPFEQVVEVPFEETLSLAVKLEKGADEDKAPVAAGPQRFRVLVLDPTPNDPGVPNPRTIGSLVAVELATLEHFDVLTSADLKQLAELEVERQSVGCSDTSCLAEIAGALGASLVVFGDVGKLGDLLIVNVSLFDSEKARSLGRASVRTSSLEELPGKVGAALRGLAAGFLKSKGIEVDDMEVTGGDVEKEAAPVRETPAAPVIVEDKAPQPPTEPFDAMAAAPWAISGTGGVLLVGGSVAALVFAQPAFEAWTAYSAWERNPSAETRAAYALKKAAYEEGDDDELTYASIGAAAVGAALVVGGVVWGLWPGE